MDRCSTRSTHAIVVDQKDTHSMTRPLAPTVYPGTHYRVRSSGLASILNHSPALVRKLRRPDVPRAAWLVARNYRAAGIGCKASQVHVVKLDDQ